MGNFSEKKCRVSDWNDSKQSSDQVLLQVHKEPEMKNCQTEIMNSGSNGLFVKDNSKMERNEKQNILYYKMKAVFLKNCTLVLRGKARIPIIITLPAKIAMITCTTYRNGPKEVRIGIVNLDFHD